MNEIRLIDANALKEELLKDEYISWDCEYAVTHEDIKRVIDNAPTVEAPTYTDVVEANKEGYNTARRLYERPQGEWILRTDTEWHFECNQCKGLSPWKAQFCGVCGADMRKDGAE